MLTLYPRTDSAHANNTSSDDIESDATFIKIIGINVKYPTRTYIDLFSCFFLSFYTNVAIT